MDEPKVVLFQLRLPAQLHEQLRQEAEKNRRSLHSEILWRLEKEGRTNEPTR